MSIPQTIHYCWFGHNPKPAIIKKCIRSWKKYCPDYQMIEWNEENYDLKNAPRYVKQAYEAKKWAFVTDYIRLDVLYEYGGIYMDTDVELVKPLDPFLKYDCFIGFQHERYVNTGLVTGATACHPFIEENKSVYLDFSFQDNDDSHQLMVCQEYTTNILKAHGLVVPCTGQIQIVEGIHVFPPEYFCPYDHRAFKLTQTDNTVAIHHFASSWWDAERLKKYRELKRQIQLDNLAHTPNRAIMRLLGHSRYDQLKKAIKRKNHTV